MFSQKEQLRYARHFSVDRIGVAGQAKLKNARVFCVGVGGIGSPLALYLTACGIGSLTIIDHDVVELSNLQRQILFSQADLGQSKARAANQKLSALNDSTCLTVIEKKLTYETIDVLTKGYDIIIDGCDNYETRYLVADACALYKIPLISASVYQFSGQLISLSNEHAPCFRCLYPEPPDRGVIPNCAEAGVLGTVPGTLGVMAATEAIKKLLNFPEKLHNELMNFNLLNLSLKKYPIVARETCRVCQRQITLDALHGKVAQSRDLIDDMQVDTLQAWRLAGKKFTLVDVRQDWERDICQISGDIHIPLADLDVYPVDELHEPIVVYCKSGVRSYVGATKLHQKGCQQVYNLAGGVIAWVKQIEPQQRVY